MAITYNFYKKMSTILKILTNPNPNLRKKSKEVDLEIIKTDEFQNFLSDLSFTMSKRDGVGLAAPQVGKNIRVMVISTKDLPKFFINPVITKRSWAKNWDEEGCLSVPKTFGEVRRNKKITCIFYDKDGKKRKIEVEDLFARIIQHEIDHLDGILFIDKAENIKKV